MQSRTDSSEYVFIVDQLNYAYNWGSPLALSELSLKIPHGVATAILGLSGSGKSTLLAILGRLIECPVAPGQIGFFSAGNTRLDYSGLTHSDSGELRLRKFGFIMQSANMLTNFSCRSNIEMPLTLQGVPAAERSAKLTSLIDRLRAAGDRAEIDQLVNRLDSLPSEVSGGQRQRMAVLRALIHDPEVVFADEPCNSLDPLNAALFRELLVTWQSESSGQRSLILVTHNAHEAWQIADRIAIVKRHGIGDLPVMDRASFANPDEIEQLIIESGRGKVPATT